MADIIRPDFGGPKPEAPGPDDYLPLEVVGVVGAYLVGLVRGAGERGDEIRVVVGLEAGMDLHAVAQYPADDGSEEDAQACARAVLRAMEIVGGEPPAA